MIEASSKKEFLKKYFFFILFAVLYIFEIGRTYLISGDFGVIFYYYGFGIFLLASGLFLLLIKRRFLLSIYMTMAFEFFLVSMVVNGLIVCSRHSCELAELFIVIPIYLVISIGIGQTLASVIAHFFLDKSSPGYERNHLILTIFLYVLILNLLPMIVPFIPPIYNYMYVFI